MTFFVHSLHTVLICHLCRKGLLGLYSSYSFGITNYPKTWHLKTTISFYLKGHGWAILTQGLSCGHSQMLAGAVVSESSTGLTVQNGSLTWVAVDFGWMGCPLGSPHMASLVWPTQGTRTSLLMSSFPQDKHLQRTRWELQGLLWSSLRSRVPFPWHSIGYRWIVRQTRLKGRGIRFHLLMEARQNHIAEKHVRWEMF